MLHDRAGCCVAVRSGCAPWGQHRLTGCRAAVSHGVSWLPTAWRGGQHAALAVARPRRAGPRETRLPALTPRDLLRRRGCRSLPCPNAALCQARRNGVQLLQPSVARSLQEDVRAPCFATLAAGGIRKVSHGGSDLPKVARRVCSSGEARLPAGSVPAVALAVATCGCMAHAHSWY